MAAKKTQSQEVGGGGILGIMYRFSWIGTSYMIIIMYRTSLAVCVPSCLVTLLD